MRYLKNPHHFLKHFIAVPVVVSVAIPLLILDVWAEIYHRICFPLYRMPYIKRSNYIVVDRHKLKYLNVYQKIYCAYCGYANGLMQYLARMAGDTETYWCGVQHQQKDDLTQPPHHSKFVAYGNEKDFRDTYVQ